MNFKKIIFFIICAFLGYSVGRFGHVLGGLWIMPHHWIFGLLMVIGGYFLRKRMIGKLLIAAGIGVFISDLNDFFCFRIYGPDLNETFRFWGID